MGSGETAFSVKMTVHEGFKRPEIFLNKADSILKTNSCPKEVILTFQVDAAKIQENTPLYSPIQYFTQPFKPYIDDFNTDPFIPKDPLDMIEAGEFNDVPLILGNNKDEGLMNALTFYYKPELLEEVTRKWNVDQGPFFVGARFVLCMMELSSS